MPTRHQSAASRTEKPLAEYKRKRDFEKTREPEGTAVRSAGKRALRFVIQKHAASHLHYDFRLELDGVMKSWAVPKGPSYDPGVRRLAMEVEDHPIEYNKFEGTIPQGQYGGGTVMLWDRGTYEAESGGGVEALRDGYDRGDLKFIMHGERLRGGWVLVRMHREAEGKPQWLLIKHRDDTADPGYDVTADVTTSVTTGRTMEEIGAGRGVWQSNRASSDDAAPKKRPAKKAAKRPARKAAKRPAKKAVRATTRGRTTAAKRATKRTTKKATRKARRTSAKKSR